MPIEEALEELKKYAAELVAVGDVDEYLKQHKEDFAHKLGHVMRCYEYIINSPNTTNRQYVDAMDIIDDIKYDNESLEGYVDLIMSEATKKQTKSSSPQKASSEIIDPSMIASKIDSFVNEVTNMEYWDTDKIDDLEWHLNECQKTLITYKEHFTKSMYDSLMDDINTALNKIAKFYGVINSDSMENLKR